VAGPAFNVSPGAGRSLSSDARIEVTLLAANLWRMSDISRSPRA
jgi:hypothetical protein